MSSQNLDLLLEKNRCGAVLSVARSQWPGISGEDKFFDLRLQERGIVPFGGLEDLEKLLGSPFVTRPEFAKEMNSVGVGVGHFADLDLLLGIRKKGHRVLCALEDRQATPPVLFGLEEQLQARLWITSKYFPELFLPLLAESPFLKNVPGKEEDFFYRLFKRFIAGQEPEDLKRTLPVLTALLTKKAGENGANRALGRFELLAGYRVKPSVAIYDHALQLAGGGQKYACTIAAALQSDFDITFISNKPVTLGQLEAWYGLELGLCKIKIIPLPFYEEKRSEFIDQGMAKRARENPFDLISEESKRYDVFINVNMLTLIKPLSPVSIFLCHFPDSDRGRFFFVGEYTHIIANSLYTIEWLKKRWNFSPTAHIYPPIDMPTYATEKQPIILSVARFENSGTKKQLELIEEFARLRAQSPAIAGWKLVLAGGSFGKNLYLKKVQKRARAVPGVEVYVNLSVGQLRTLYARASIFWHACGLGAKTPERIEHFGMTTVEAMQNGCVPVVINKGGQKETVEQRISGFLFDDLKGLREFSLKLIENKDLFERLSAAARVRSKRFNRERFDWEISDLFSGIRRKLTESRLL